MTYTAKPPRQNNHAAAYGVVIRSRAKAAMNSVHEAQMSHEAITHHYSMTVHEFVLSWMSPGATNQCAQDLIYDVVLYCAGSVFRVGDTRYCWHLEAGRLHLWSKI